MISYQLVKADLMDQLWMWLQGILLLILFGVAAGSLYLLSL